MFKSRMTARIAAATLAAALTLGGLFGVGSVAAGHDHQDAPTEEAGATWSFTARLGGKGWSSTNGGTWS